MNIDPPERRQRRENAGRQLWVTGAFLILGGFVAGLVRPEATSHAQAVGRAVGQILLMASGIVLVLVDLVKGRGRQEGNGDGS